MNGPTAIPKPSSTPSHPFAAGRHRWGRRVLRGAVGTFGLCLVGLGGEALIRARLDPDELRAPTRIYAQPLVLYEGQTLDTDAVEGYLERVGYRAVSRRPRNPGEFRLTSRRLELEQRAFRHMGRVLTEGHATVELTRGGRVSDIEIEHEGSARYLVLEPPMLRTVTGREGEDRVPVPLEQIPDVLPQAVLAVEDRRFYHHHGIDVIRVVGAGLANVRAGRLSQGGSTITQQLIKNRFLTPRRSFVRKIRELTMAVVLELRHSKEEILEAYLNEVYLAQDGRLAVHGVGRASQYFFGKDVRELDVHEAALLAGMIRGPSLYNPRRNPERARERRDLVLRMMRDAGVLDEDAFAHAVDRPLRLSDPTTRTPIGRYFTDYVLQTLEDNLGPVVRRGHAVFTSLDVRVQAFAERAARDGLRALEREHPDLTKRGAPLQVAIVAIDPRTGGILAMVGGRDYGRSQFNRAVLARRQPGSAFKPVVALAALQRGGEFTLASTIADEPLSVRTPAGLWQPANYDERFRGTVTLRDALERSLNVPMARVGLAVGPERIVETAKRLGIGGPLPAVPSLALGTSEVTPLELTRAFAVFAAEGVRMPSVTTLGVFTPDDRIVATPPDEGERVVDADVAYLITSALQGAVERGTGRGLRQFGFRGDVAAKSGTTNEFRDAWFVGYTPTIVIGVWVGFDDGTPVGLPGARAALPIFARLLLSAKGRDGDAGFAVPWDVEIVEIDPETGLRAGRGCRGQPEAFLRGTAPEESCSPYFLSWGRETDRRINAIAELLRRQFARRRGRN